MGEKNDGQGVEDGSWTSVWFRDRDNEETQLEGEETKTWRFFKNEQGWRGSERSRCEGQHMLDVKTKPERPGLDVSRGAGEDGAARQEVQRKT